MISIVKLTNGIELIGDIVQYEKEFIVIKDPLQINYRQRMDMSPPTVSLHRYVPFSSHTVFNFLSMHVLNLSVPLPGLVKYYNATLKTLIESIDSSINEELEMAASFYFGESEDDQIKRAMVEIETLKPTIN